MKFFQEEYIKNFPDSYNKEKTSANYKLMQLLRYDEELFRGVLQELWDSLSIHSATGYALDLYGDMYGQPRGRLTDEQYRYIILNTISRNRSGCDHNSVISALASMIGAPIESFWFEDAETSGNVDVKLFPYDALQAAGITVPQVWRMIESLLAAGVRITGLNVTHELDEAPMIAATAITHAEAYVLGVEAVLYETVNSNINSASVVTHGEKYNLEVVE